MKEIFGNLFKCVKAEAICITTNGYVKKNGGVVMGRGCALEATKRWPGVEDLVAHSLSGGKNVPTLLTLPQEENPNITLLPTPMANYIVPYHVVTFPVKPIRCGGDQLLPRFQNDNTSRTSVHPGWMSQAKPSLIQHSAKLLVELTDKHGWSSVIIPKPGCGAGGLDWKDVKPLIADILDDRFYLITFPKR